MDPTLVLNFSLDSSALGWPRTIYYFAKNCPIYKFRTVLKSWSHSGFKYAKQFFLNHCLRVAHLLWSLANFCITSKGILLFIQVFSFGKVLVPYRKIEMVIYTVFSFGLRQNFKSNARPFNYGLEKNGWKKSNSELSQLFKTVQNLKIGRGLANGPH